MSRATRVASGALLAVSCALGVVPAGAVSPGTTHAVAPERTGLPFELVSFPSAGDSVRLSGWWFGGPAGSPVLVLCPRGTGTMSDLLPSAREFVLRGFTVMTYDLRDFGPGSPGLVDSLRYLVFASRWVDDTEGAFRFARARAGTRRVFGWGQDLGGPLALAAASHDASLLDALAVEGMFENVQQQLLYNGTAQVPGVQEQHRELVRQGDNPAFAAPLLRVPLLVVLSMKDTVTPPDVTRKATRFTRSIIERWTLPDARHDGAELTPGYFDHVAGYFKRIAALLPPSHP